MENNKYVKAETDGAVLSITIDRPEVLNAFNLVAAQELEAILDRFEETSELRVAVLSGAGENFSSGQDLKAAANGEMAITERRGPLGITARPATKPVIAAVEGFALGGGFELALACDMVVAAENAKFGLPEVIRGLAPLAGGVGRIAQRLPAAIGAEYLLTGRRIPPAELAHHGIINKVVPEGTAREEALAMAKAIAGNGPFAVRKILEVQRQARSLSDSEVWDLQQTAHDEIGGSDDAKEGLTAFLEKRDPVWK